MVRIALTGGIACGKSLVGNMLSSKGCDVIEADEIARELMRPGTEVCRDVKREFGHGIFDESGQVDRKLLGRLVMDDPGMRCKLNTIVHPHVIARWEGWLKEREGAKGVATVIVPLLYEAGQGDGWDAVICVYTARSIQVARLAERGIVAEDAAKWLAAQMKLSDKMRNADYVICNSGSKQVLEQQIDDVINKIVER